jgi:hypothetical protein
MLQLEPTAYETIEGYLCREAAFAAWFGIEIVMVSRVKSESTG